jgi:hypothetical protein
MLRFRSRLFSASVKDFVDEVTKIVPHLTGENLAAVALALRARELEWESEKERLMREKVSEKRLLVQQFVPMYNQRALEILVRHLRESEKFQHVVVEFKGGSRRNRLNMVATADRMRAYLETDGCTNKRELRALRKIFQDLSDELQYAAADEHRICAVGGPRARRTGADGHGVPLAQPERYLSRKDL